MAAPTSNLGKAGRAIVMRNPGSTDVLHLEKEWYTAAPAPGEILVHTVSTSVNPVDTYQRSGKYRLQFFPKVLGSDVAGQVVMAREGGKFKAYDKVFALTDGYLGKPDSRGTYAEYVLVREEWAARVPDALPLNIAGAVPLVALTAWQAMLAAQPQPGQRMLILGASGGVGHFAVQFAKLRDAHVVGSCCARSAELVRGLGAEPWDYTAGASGLRDAFGASDNTKFDFVLDLIGGELLQAAMQTLKFGGAVVHVMNRGTDADFVKRQEAASRDGSGPRWHTILVQPNGAQLEQIAELFEQGKLKLNVACVMPLEDVAKAHQLVESGHAGGKVVLKVT